MNPTFGWILAGLLVAAATFAYGWQGTVFGASCAVFWLLLQFSRTMRVLRTAGERPVGQVASAVMLHSKLKAGMPLLEVVRLTRSLGQRVSPARPPEGARTAALQGGGSARSEAPEVWRWADAGGAAVEVELHGGRVVRWQLQRPPEAAPPLESPA